MEGVTDQTPPAAAESRREDDPLAMDVVVRLERGAKPSVTVFCEAVAEAVVRYLDEARDPTSAHHASVSAWYDGRIRKIVRRARGAAFTALANAPGRIIPAGGLEVYVGDPVARSLVTPAVSRAQIEGLHLEDPSPRRERSEPAGAVVVYVNPEWGLVAHPGKAAAQCAHAAQLALDRQDPLARQATLGQASPVRVVWPDAALWSELRSGAEVVIRDAGFTVLPRPGETTIAMW